jgi:phosphoserine phosphatase
MQEMIRYGFPNEPKRYRLAREAFSAQVRGRLSVAEAFSIAGRQTRGLTLEAAIHYSAREVQPMDGFHELMRFIRDSSMNFCIVSTGYTVTLYSIRYSHSMPSFHMRCNRLLFAADTSNVLEEEALEELVRRRIEGDSSLDLCHRYRATGEIELLIGDEADKPALIMEVAQRLGVKPQEIAHVGDTMGDSQGILQIARAGGLGIAFNYNEELEAFLKREGGEELDSGNIVLVDPKGKGADLSHVIPFLMQ